MKKFLILVLVIGALIISACSSAANTASANLSTKADNFQIYRRVLFYNGITGQTAFEVDGLCSIGNADKPGEVSITCKVGPGTDGKGVFLKHFLGLSDNMTYIVIQSKAVPADPYHYETIYRPDTIVPNLQLDTQNNPLDTMPALTPTATP